MSETYRLTWEMVLSHELHHFCNANPMFYKNTKQTVPNSEIPDKYWRSVERITEDPWSQYHTLKQWAGEDRGFVRNVHLYVGEVTEVTWREVNR